MTEFLMRASLAAAVLVPGAGSMMSRHGQRKTDIDRMMLAVVAAAVSATSTEH